MSDTNGLRENICVFTNQNVTITVSMVEVMNLCNVVFEKYSD